MIPERHSSHPSLHIPFTILALAIAVLLAAQIGASKKSAEIMVWQRDTLEKQIASLKTADVQLAETIEKREPLVKQSGELKAKLESLANDLVDLAREDPDAKQIVAKWNIQRATPSAEEKKAP